MEGGRAGPGARAIKDILAFAGFAATLVGIVVQSRVIVWIAIGLLSASFLVRLYIKRVTGNP